MKRLGLLVLVVVLGLAQTSLLPLIRPLGVVPNVALALTVLIALLHTTRLALGVAVGLGVALDLASGANFGLWTGLLVLAVLAAAFIRQAGIEVDGPAVALVLVTVGTILMTVIVLLGLLRTVSHWPAAYVAGHLLAELMLNLLVVMALRPLVRMTSDPMARG